MKHKEKYILLTIWIFFFIILAIAPITGDDWGNYLVGLKGFENMFGKAIEMYFTWEGRLISRILINILTYYKWIWVIINSTLITGLIYLIATLSTTKKEKKKYLFATILILGMDPYMFGQIITWIAGNITYLFPLVLICAYLFYFEKKKETGSTLRIFLLGLFNFLTPMFVEHMAFLLVCINFFYFCKQSYNKKCIAYKELFYLLMSLTGSLLMYFSPGTYQRSQLENQVFQSLSIIDKIKYNIPNFITYTFLYNINFLILWILSNIKIIIKSDIAHYSKIILVIIQTIIPTLAILARILQYFSINSPLSIMLNSSKWYVILYWISSLLLYILLLHNNQNKNKIYLFILLGLISNGIMLISPTWGARTAFASMIFLSIAVIITLEENYLKKVLTILIITLALGYLLIYTKTFINSKENERRIDSANKSNSNIITLIKHPNFIGSNPNPVDKYHEEKFKEYYKISKDTKLELE